MVACLLAKGTAKNFRFFAVPFLVSRIKNKVSHVAYINHKFIEERLGIGIMLCNDLLKRMGASLQVESELGKGTAMKIVINS